MRLRPVIGWTVFACLAILIGRIMVAWVLVHLGVVLAVRGNYQAAESVFSKATYIRNDSCASCGMGLVYRLQKRNSEAESWLRRSIELDPNDTCAYNELGRMYYDLEDYPKAIDAFNRESKLHSTASLSHFLADSYFFSGQVEQSVKYYQESAKLDPKYERVLVDLGSAYGSLHRYREAEQTYRQALKLKPKDLRARSLLGTTLFILGDKEGAMQEYRKVKEINPERAAEMFAGFEKLSETTNAATQRDVPRSKS